MRRLSAALLACCASRGGHAFVAIDPSAHAARLGDDYEWAVRSVPFVELAADFWLRRGIRVPENHRFGIRENAHRQRDGDTKCEKIARAPSTARTGLERGEERRKRKTNDGG